MTEPTDRDREMADSAVNKGWVGFQYRRDAVVAAVADAIADAKAGKPNLPPLFEDDDWLWVAKSLGYVSFSGDDAGFAERHRMDRIIAKILEYRAEDAPREPWGMNEWRPIDTAPKGPVLLYFPEVSHRSELSMSPMWKVGRATDYPHRKTTHWMPLPEPPKCPE